MHEKYIRLENNANSVQYSPHIVFNFNDTLISFNRISPSFGKHVLHIFRFILAHSDLFTKQNILLVY